MLFSGTIIQPLKKIKSFFKPLSVRPFTLMSGKNKRVVIQ